MIDYSNKLKNINEEIPIKIDKSIFTPLSKEKIYSLLINEIYKPLPVEEWRKIIPTRNGELLLKIEEFCGLLFEAIEELVEYNDTDTQYSNRKSIFYIKEYIDNYYFEKISLEIFSKKYYTSREHLTRCFKEAFGCGIYKYLLKVRMENAKKMLDNPNIKICNVAESIGYSDYNYFSKAFKNYFEISPSEYRLQHKKIG